MKDEANEDHLEKSMVADYQERLSRQRLEVNELLQQREALLRTQKMMRELNVQMLAHTYCMFVAWLRHILDCSKTYS